MPKNNRGLTIASLISAPLVAAATANDAMLKEQTKLLMDFCFSQNGNRYEPIVVTMSFTKTIINSGRGNEPAPFESVETLFQVPLITLIPLTSLAIDKMSIKFNMEVTFQGTTDDSSGTFFAPQKKTNLQGVISSDSQDATNIKRKNLSTIKLNANINTVPLPLGVVTILDVYTKSIHLLPKEK